MTTVVLEVLALAWVGVAVFWLRSRSKGSFGDSVGMFHRHLHVLERAAPGTLTAASRLRVPAGHGPVPLSARMGSAPVARQRPSGSSLTTTARRRQTLRRRRDVLFVLAILVVVTLVAAVATGAKDVVIAQVLCDVVLGGYVAMLVRIRNLAAERELKLRVLPVQPAYATARAPRQTAARQAAAARRAQSGYALAGYGDMGLRRAASS